MEEGLARPNGPPNQRAQRNREAVDALVREFTEPGLRGLLRALSSREYPLCAHWLSEYDLDATPLGEMIHPYTFCGRSLTVESAEPPLYTVEISMGFGDAGDGGCIRAKRDGDTFTLVNEIELCTF